MSRFPPDAFELPFFRRGARGTFAYVSGFKVAKHNKGDSAGKKKERPAIRVIPKSRFRFIETTAELVNVLFDLPLRHHP